MDQWLPGVRVEAEHIHYTLVKTPRVSLKL